METEGQSQHTQEQARASNVTINNPQETNTMGIAGFVLALISLFVGWIPFFGWIVWLLGLIFSIIGVTKEPRGFAIAGLIISFIGVILLIVLFMGILSLGFLGSL